MEKYNNEKNNSSRENYDIYISCDEIECEKDNKCKKYNQKCKCCKCNNCDKIKNCKDVKKCIEKHLCELKGDKGDIGPQGEQGPAGPQGEMGIEGLIGPMGPEGQKGEPGPEGPAGVRTCPCEVTFGKVINFLIRNETPFKATTSVGLDKALESKEDAPAHIFNTWGLEFERETIIPISKLKVIYLDFKTEQERSAYITSIKQVLAQTLSCSNNYNIGRICSEELKVDEYLSIENMKQECEYEYYLKGECNWNKTQCNVCAKKIDLCNLVNTQRRKIKRYNREKARGR